MEKFEALKKAKASDRHYPSDYWGNNDPRCQCTLAYISCIQGAGYNSQQRGTNKPERIPAHPLLCSAPEDYRNKCKYLTIKPYYGKSN